MAPFWSCWFGESETNNSLALSQFQNPFGTAFYATGHRILGKTKSLPLFAKNAEVGEPCREASVGCVELRLKSLQKPRRDALHR
jgi:hypothetical protein